jgi:hypothetical protein
MLFQIFVGKFFNLVLVAGKCAITRDFLLARRARDWREAASLLLGFVHITDSSCHNEKRVLDLEKSFIFAKSSVFMKQSMYDRLELLSCRIRNMMIVKIQRHFRVRICQRKAIHTALSITSRSLAYFTNVKFNKVRREMNARIVIQRFAQRALILLRHKRHTSFVVKMQAFVRGKLTRRQLHEQNFNTVRQVSSKWMRLVKHKQFLRKCAAALKIQSVEET